MEWYTIIYLILSITCGFCFYKMVCRDINLVIFYGIFWPVAAILGICYILPKLSELLEENLEKIKYYILRDILYILWEIFILIFCIVASLELPKISETGICIVPFFLILALSMLPALAMTISNLGFNLDVYTTNLSGGKIYRYYIYDGNNSSIIKSEGFCTIKFIKNMESKGYVWQKNGNTYSTRSWTVYYDD